MSLTSFGGLVELEVLGATGIDPRYSRCQAVVNIGKRELCTLVVQVSQGDSAVWNESFRFVPGDDSVVSLTLFGRTILDQDVLLGSKIAPYRDIQMALNGGKEQTLVLEPSASGQNVSLVLRLNEGNNPSSTSNPQRTFAYLIGINHYTHYPNLAGSVNDVHAMQRFLLDRLRVPPAHIHLLLDAQATRDAIISNFHTSLTDNDQVQEGDTMLFFYAGHGSRVSAPEGWTSPDNRVEVICPHDMGAADAVGNSIPGIPDRTISALLRRLAAKKGNSIVAIMDSCHSGGLNRTSRIPRFVPDSPPLSDTQDMTVWSVDLPRHVKQFVQSGFLHTMATSHVFLAGCRPEESAYEVTSTDGQPGGAFTTALVEALATHDINQMTYQELMDCLPVLSGQEPQCEGTHLNRIVFTTKEGKDHSRAFKLVDNEDGTYIVHAGEVQGVDPGAEFSIHGPNSQPGDSDLGILMVTVVGPHTCVTQRRPGDGSFIVPTGSIAKVRRWNDFTLKVFVHDSESSDETRPTASLEVKEYPEQAFKLVRSRADADLVLFLTAQDKVAFERADTMMYVNPKPNILLDNDVETLTRTLDAVSLFHFHLYRTSVAHPLGDRVRMEVFTLKSNRANKTDIYVPDGQDLLQGREELQIVDTGDETLYGINITNDSDHDLHPYLFYFDPSDYSIQAALYPPNRKIPLLPRRQRLTSTSVAIGYGSAGAEPFSFTLNEGELSDTGYFKLFVSTTYVEMRWLEQSSPVEKPPSDDVVEGHRIAKRAMLSQQHKELWDTWLLKVTVRDK